MMSEATPISETKSSPASGLLTFIAGNLASISAIGVFAAVVCSTLFLYGYLSVFDWRLIWIIDYPDILKVGLVAFAVLSGFSTVVISTIQYALSLFAMKRKRTWAYINVMILNIFLLGVLIYILWPSEASFIMAPMGMVLAGMLWLFFIVKDFLTGDNRSFRNVMFLFTALIGTVYFLGNIFGIVTKHYNNGTSYDVFLKKNPEMNDVMNDVQLVLFTSHHTVLYSGNQVIALPTSDIVKIVTHPKGKQPQ